MALDTDSDSSGVKRPSPTPDVLDTPERDRSKAPKGASTDLVPATMSSKQALFPDPSATRSKRANHFITNQMLNNRSLPPTCRQAVENLMANNDAAVEALQAALARQAELETKLEMLSARVAQLEAHGGAYPQPAPAAPAQEAPEGLPTPPGSPQFSPTANPNVFRTTLDKKSILVSKKVKTYAETVARQQGADQALAALAAAAALQPPRRIRVNPEPAPSGAEESELEPVAFNMVPANISDMRDRLFQLGIHNRMIPDMIFVGRRFTVFLVRKSYVAQLVRIIETATDAHHVPNFDPEAPYNTRLNQEDAQAAAKASWCRRVLARVANACAWHTTVKGRHAAGDTRVTTAAQVVEFWQAQHEKCFGRRFDPAAPAADQ